MKSDSKSQAKNQLKQKKTVTHGKVGAHGSKYYGVNIPTKVRGTLGGSSTYGTRLMFKIGSQCCILDGSFFTFYLL